MTFVVDLKLQSELNELCDCKNLLLAQVYHTDLVSITLPKFHYLFDLTNEVMQRLRDAGIIQHSVDFHKWILHRQINSSTTTRNRSTKASVTNESFF
ncbi:hypothetical protein PVAND_012563 [Polypedilum vanderplanki]|uniref:Uncharacterized protein n=1 Tax=Polypedilum vanderplanki TaxID=319348 RepID=A0A9J6CM07_POLVA|nr:hypothetical protein PVAND_012563 [Polypedilum vanderplanki]